MLYVCESKGLGKGAADGDDWLIFWMPLSYTFYAGR
jgi:hypothetical protein